LFLGGDIKTFAVQSPSPCAEIALPRLSIRKPEEPKKKSRQIRGGEK
jgi:hypothetical protein